MTAYYATFRDGALGYACARCDQRCCRGGILVDPTRDTLVRIRSRPRLFSRPSRAPGMIIVEQFGERCEQLADDGRCSIQVTERYEAKPLYCRLFPASVLRRIPSIDTIAITPSFLCPLEVVTPGSDQAPLVAGPAQEILAEHDLGSHIVDVTLPSGTPVDFLELEAACRDLEASQPDADYIDHAARQLVRSAYRLIGEAPSRLGGQEVANARADLLIHLAMLGRMLGVDTPPALSPASTACLIAMTGPIRFDLLRLFHASSYEAAIERIPFALCSIAWLAAHYLDAQRLVRGGTTELTPAILAGLFETFGRRAVLLSRLLDVPYLDELPTLAANVPHAEPLGHMATAIAADEHARRTYVATTIADPRPAKALFQYLEQIEPAAERRGELLYAAAEHLPLRFHSL